MANLKSAIKRVDTNQKKRERNNPVKAEMRTNIKRTEHLVAENNVEEATRAFHQTIRMIDRAISKGVIHRNNGNRHKTRLAKKVNGISA